MDEANEFVWVFVRPDHPYNFAMIPATPKDLDLKSFYTKIQKLTKWIWVVLSNV